MKYKIGISTILMFILIIFSCEDPEPPVDTPDYDDIVILHEKWPFPVGVAVPGAKTNNAGMSSGQANALNSSNPQNALLKHFNVVVAENEMKPENIMPGTKPSGDNWKDSYTWTNADALVNYAKTNNKQIRGHCLFWHDQTPNWFFSGDINQLYTNMENHVKAVFQKYKGDIGYWDVVNEAVDHDVAGPRVNSGYTKAMVAAGKTGMDRYEYILKAFQWARQYADQYGTPGKVKLYLTDFGVERPFDRGGTTKQADFLALAKYLVDNNAPIDGVGFQGHFRLYDHPVGQISEGIDMFSRINGKDLKIQICELDISIFSNTKGEANAAKVSSSVLNQRLSDLAQTYRDFFDMFKVKYDEGKLDMVVLWGIADGHSWLNDHPVKGRTDHPLLFNRNYKGKEAYMLLTDQEIPAN